MGNWPSIRPGGQDDSVELEQDLVLADADPKLLLLHVPSHARQLLESPGGHVHLEAGWQRGLERRLLDAQAVGVGGDHAQLTIGGRHEDAGEHRSCLVTRR